MADSDADIKLHIVVETDKGKTLTYPNLSRTYAKIPKNEPPFSQRETLRERVRQSPIVTETAPVGGWTHQGRQERQEVRGARELLRKSC
jgi:hypothetical protein